MSTPPSPPRPPLLTGPQEYTIIKLKVLEFPGALAPLSSKAGSVFLAPATLRPETMYGQTNCFALPEGKYGAYEMLNGDVFIISERSAKGFSCQGYTEVRTCEDEVQRGAK